MKISPVTLPHSCDVVIRRVVLVVLLFAALSNAFARDKDNKTIYKWQSNGQTFYSHIKPKSIENYTELDSQGRKIKQFSDSFDEIIVTPKTVLRPDAITNKHVITHITEPAARNTYSDNAMKSGEVSLRTSNERSSNESTSNQRTASQNTTQATLSRYSENNLTTEQRCARAQQDLHVLQHDEVYAEDAFGNMTKLNAKAIERKMATVKNNIDFFCEQP